MKKLLLILLCFPMIGFGQGWQYKEGSNVFDGAYRTSFVEGIGSDYPYNAPLLCINKFDLSDDFNFYISRSGYFQEESDINIEWVFDSEPNILYSISAFSISPDRKILFLEEFTNPKKDHTIKKIEIIEKLQKGNKVNIRISNKYGSNDLVFSLKGSTKAINFALPFEYRNKLILELNAERDELKKRKLELSNKLKIYELTNEETEEIIRRIIIYNVSNVDSIIFKKDYDEYFNVLLVDSNGEELKELRFIELPSLYDKYYLKLSNKLKSFKLTDEETEKIIKEITRVLDKTSNYSFSDIDSINITKDLTGFENEYFFIFLLDDNGNELEKISSYLKIPSLYEKYEIQLKSKKEFIYKLMDKYTFETETRDEIYERIENFTAIGKFSILDVDSISLQPIAYDPLKKVNIYLFNVNGNILSKEKSTPYFYGNNKNIKKIKKRLKLDKKNAKKK